MLKIDNQLKLLKIYFLKGFVVITGGTGIGKTTQIPKIIWWFSYLFPKNIDLEVLKFSFNDITKGVILSLPRKINITAIRERILDEVGLDSINFTFMQTFYRDRISDDYNAFFNPLKSSYLFLSIHQLTLNLYLKFENRINTIIVDEVHEHNFFALFMVSFFKHFLKDNLIILMSGTIIDDKIEFKNYFGNNINYLEFSSKYNYEIVDLEVEKFDYPVLINKLYIENKILFNQSIILFQSSKKKVYIVASLLRSKLNSVIFHIEICHSEISNLRNIIKNTLNNNKITIFVTTPILESSITIPNAKIVLDDNLFIAPYFRETKEFCTTRSMMLQRKGRVGRTDMGYYIHLPFKNNIDYRNIDNEYLWVYLISSLRFNISFNELFYPPNDLNRFEKSINYLEKFNIKINNKNEIIEFYNLYTNSLYPLIEYYTIVLNKNLVFKEVELNDFCLKPTLNISSFLLEELIGLNLEMKLINKTSDYIKFQLIKEFENKNDNFVFVTKRNIHIYKFNGKYLLLHPKLVIQI